MDIRRRFFFHLRPFAVGELAACVAGLAEALGRAEAKVKLSLNEEAADGSSVRRDTDAAAIQTICRLSNVDINIRVGEFDSGIYCYFSELNEKLLQVTINAPDATLIVRLPQYIKSSLGVRQATDAERKEIQALHVRPDLLPLVARLERLESAVFSPTRKLRCFLSYRFNSENELVALKLAQFLTLLGVEVISGASYEPRQISEKVLAKLRQPLDFIVLLISSHGESMWTRDEIGTALHKDLAIVPIVEEGLTLAPGMFADIEYVQFSKSHIGDSFLKLLEAVAFIREQSSTQIGKTAG